MTDISDPDPAAAYIDLDRTVCLCDAGQPAYLAATAIDAYSGPQLLLAGRDTIGDPAVTYDPRCPRADHEQSGALPIDVVRRVAIATRRNRSVTPRCGRPTRAGTPCRMPMQRPGDACGRHR
jgi:hypothetical protein